MKVNKEQKGFIIWWIDRQFNTDKVFPTKFRSENGEVKVTHRHIHAYKEWRKLPLKTSKIQHWIDHWMSEEDQAELQHALKQYKKTLH